MGIAKVSELGMLLAVGEPMDCETRGGLREGEETVDDVSDIIEDDGVESGFLKNGWVLYCLERDSWLGK
jgi:hypothetical protein